MWLLKGCQTLGALMLTSATSMFDGGNAMALLADRLSKEAPAVGQPHPHLRIIQLVESTHEAWPGPHKERSFSDRLPNLLRDSGIEDILRQAHIELMVNSYVPCNIPRLVDELMRRLG
jgi:hypothetical protein